MNLIINGDAQELPANASVTTVLEELGISATRQGMAVAVNEQIVPRSEWEKLELSENDRIEIVHAVQGG